MQNHNKQISIWLFTCCFMVGLMVMIGGLTRLTGSGLSMTGWEPVTAWLPPIGDAAWQHEFARYQTSPQYLKVNTWMNVAEFKQIFWLEYIHRLIGRIAGAIFLFPILYFAFKRAIDKPLLLRFSSIFILGGVQGIIGWLMVSSGLKDEPRVSQYWLAFHLSTAFILFAILFIIALGRFYADKHSAIPKQTAAKTLFPITVCISILVFCQIIMGAFVAGLHAGLIYNTFPLMDNKWLPEGLFPWNSLHENLFEDIKTVQFIHRSLAYIVAGSIAFLWIKANRLWIIGPLKYAINTLLAMVCIQFTLGVLTLLYAVPTPLASMHQCGALILFAISLYTNYLLVYRRGE
jgi:cytochrome c oxidase assembly protein subunit 15